VVANVVVAKVCSGGNSLVTVKFILVNYLHTYSISLMSLPTLKHFILKQQVLNLYRCIIRASRCVLLALHPCSSAHRLTLFSYPRPRDEERDRCLGPE